MKKIISTIIVLAMAISMSACNFNGESKKTSHKLDRCIEMLEMTDAEVKEEYDWVLRGVLDSGIGLVQTCAWNDYYYGDGSIQYLIQRYDIDEYHIIVGAIANEDYSRIRIGFVTIDNCYKSNLQNFLTNYNWNPEEKPFSDNIDYYGYIKTDGDIITVSTDSIYKELSESSQSYWMELDIVNHPYELVSLSNLAYVLSIDIDDAMSNCTCMTDINAIFTNLHAAEYYAVRGYKGYINEWRDPIDNYTDLVYALNYLEDDMIYYSYNSIHDGRDDDPYYSDSSELYSNDTSDDQYSDWYIPDYDFNKEPESMSDFIQGIDAITEFMYENFWNLIDVASGTYGN